METETRLRVPPLTTEERAKLDALAASEALLTVTMPRHVLVALLDQLDEQIGRRKADRHMWSAIDDMNSERLGAVLQTYAELDEAHAAVLGELCGASFDLVEVRDRVTLLAEVLRDLEAWTREHVPHAPAPLSPEALGALGRIRRAIQELGVDLEPMEHWEDMVFAALEAPELDQAREARAGHDFLDEDR